MRRRGHGDRGQKETGGEASTAMRCVSEACCFYFPVSEVCNTLLNDAKARHAADTLRNTHFEQGVLPLSHVGKVKRVKHLPLHTRLKACAAGAAVAVVLFQSLSDCKSAGSLLIRGNLPPSVPSLMVFYPFQPSFGDQAGMGVMSPGLGVGYDRGQYASSHGPPHGMQRQKSIGEAVCLSGLPVPAPVCLSSGAGPSTVLTCVSVASSVLSVTRPWTLSTCTVCVPSSSAS